MRNIFDQYDQPENKLTHALVSTLNNERKLLRPFLKWLGASEIPRLADLRVVEQQVPGADVSGDEAESKGLPDACIYDDAGWAVLFESKVQSKIHVGQLRRHLATASRHGYEEPLLIVIAVDHPACKLPERARAVEWRDVYLWFSKKTKRSPWAKALVEYMNVFESNMIGRDYGIRGTLTMFTGLRFDSENPYTAREGRRLIRLLGDQLQARKDLKKLGADPQAERRPAITGRGMDSVWDFIPLKTAKGAIHTAYPHLTLAFHQRHAIAAVTVPNGVKGGFRTRLKEEGVKGFRHLITEVEDALRPIVAGSEGSRPIVYLRQRHFKSQRSRGVVDALLEVDLRTIVRSSKSEVKYQPEWIDAIYELLVHKRSNIQLGVEMRFKYDCAVIRSPKAADLFAQTWIALAPLIDFVLDEN